MSETAEAPTAEAPSCSAPTDKQIIERLRALLAESDLQTTTEKMLRKKLEEEFQTELLDKKPMIRQEVERYLAEQGGDEEEEEEDEEEEDDDDDGNAAPRGSSLGSWLSEPLQAFLGEESLPRTQVVKRLWEYIKANNLQDPRDKRKILLDAKLKTLFTSPLTMFSINTQLSRHCKVNDGDPAPRRASKASGEKRPKEAKEAKEVKEAKGAKRSRKSAEEGGEPKPKSTGGINKPVQLDAVMAEWTGQPEMSRAQLSQYFWAYVKENGLQDPANKTFILCDAKLQEITGESRIKGFSFSTYIGAHIIKS